MLRALAERGIAARAHWDWRALLDDAKPDVAVVNPPFHRIGAVTHECLARGIHVLAEKPLATAWADLRALEALCRPGSGPRPGAGTRESGPKLLSMLTMRFDPAYLAGYRALASGRLGRPVLLSAQKSYPLADWEGGPRPAFYRKRAGYGGTIPWIGIHAIDHFLWFTGSRFASVSAAQTVFGNRKHGELEAAAVIGFGLASGALASAQLDFLRPHAGKKRSGAWGDDRLRVACENGVLEIRAGRAWTETARGVRELRPAKVTPLLPAFLRWVERGEPVRPGGVGTLLTTADCLAAAEAALKARDAADRGAVLAF